MIHRIVVVGAGYAGVSAALRLARRPDPARVPVTVVTGHDRPLDGELTGRAPASFEEVIARSAGGTARHPGRGTR